MQLIWLPACLSDNEPYARNLVRENLSKKQSAFTEKIAAVDNALIDT